MDFNFSLLKGKIDENELEIVSSYAERNKEGIIRELNGLNETIVGIPIKEVPAFNEAQAEDIIETFSLRKEREIIFVDLVK